MAIEWSDNILLANLADEPALSDELNMVIEQAERADTAPDIVLDFRAVGYINSSNIAQLLKLRRHLSEPGRALCICGACEEVQSVLKITGLEKMFRFAPDTLTALAMLQMDG